ncbi:MAG: 50S ribosomal protein L9 [Gammaproteobacteria bacterium]|nr:MAG: 50S ribosomal protein L9 [Gammaproteobacteria bacterium]
MEIILLEKVDNLGGIGDRVNVRSGYGRNYLLPKGKATVATPENIAIFEQRRAEFEARQAQDTATAAERGARIQALNLKLVAKAGSEGKLFGSIGTIDIAEACTAAGVAVERSEVRLPNGPIRMLGEHEVEIHLQTDVDVAVRIEVVSDGEPVADALAADDDTVMADESAEADQSAAADENAGDDDVPADGETPAV